jgi:hypothetical protein
VIQRRIKGLIALEFEYENSMHLDGAMQSLCNVEAGGRENPSVTNGTVRLGSLGPLTSTLVLSCPASILQRVEIAAT